MVWDDGADLGNYNTQQHWVTHSNGLFLVYTRKGAHNDHVFRHRAPLFIAQVDPEKLCVVRSTERVLVPERGARLGNFGVAEVSENETWVTVAEWMQTWGPQIVMPPGTPALSVRFSGRMKLQRERKCACKSKPFHGEEHNWLSCLCVFI